jgi:hypothetical protein
MADIRDLVFKRDNLEIDLELAIASLETATLRARNNLPGGSAQVARLTAEIASLRNQISSINIQIAQLRGGTPTASAGNLVNDDARAKVSNSSTQSPESGPLLLNADGRIEPSPDTNSSSNAEPYTFLQNVDTGLDGPVRRI